MTFHYQQAVRALIIFCFAALIFRLHFIGEIIKYINPKYVGLSQTASVIFLFLFFIQITRIWTKKEHTGHHCSHGEQGCSHNHDHGDSPLTVGKLTSYLVIVFPLITGCLLPAKVLDASIADKKGGMSILTKQDQNLNSHTNNDRANNDGISEKGEQTQMLDKAEQETNNLTDSPDLGNEKELSMEEFELLKQNLLNSPVIKMDEYAYSTYYDEINNDIHKFKGREIELKGFVYKEAGFKDNQLVISRFLITHCVADASVIGFLSELPEAYSLKKDTWIEARGVLDVTTFNGTELPVVKIKAWKQINEPKEPYLYPISIRIL